MKGIKTSKRKEKGLTTNGLIHGLKEGASQNHEVILTTLMFR